MVAIVVPVGVGMAALFLQWVEARLDWSLAARPSGATRTSGSGRGEATPSTLDRSYGEWSIARSAHHI